MFMASIIVVLYVGLSKKVHIDGCLGDYWRRRTFQPTLIFGELARKL